MTKLLLALVGLGAAGLYLLAREAMPWQATCVVKAIPVLCMALAVAMARRDGFAMAVVAGLVLSGLGDALLAIPGEGSFVPGLVVFLLGHLAYLVAFLSESRALRPLHALPFVAWAVAAGLFFGPHLGDLLVPVLAYVVVICTMMWRAAARVGRRATPDLWWGLVGAVLFGSSDTVVAANNFVVDVPAASWVIMLTYWPGQLGLMAAAIWRRRP